MSERAVLTTAMSSMSIAVAAHTTARVQRCTDTELLGREGEERGGWNGEGCFGKSGEGGAGRGACWEGGAGRWSGVESLQRERLVRGPHRGCPDSEGAASRTPPAPQAG